jgi:hypothetical protein
MSAVAISAIAPRGPSTPQGGLGCTRVQRPSTAVPHELRHQLATPGDCFRLQPPLGSRSLSRLTARSG